MSASKRLKEVSPNEADTVDLILDDDEEAVTQRGQQDENKERGNDCTGDDFVDAKARAKKSATKQTAQRTLNYGGREIKCTKHMPPDWVGNKSAEPWSFFERYIPNSGVVDVPAPKNSKQSGVGFITVKAFYECSFKECPYIYAHEDGKDESKLVRKQLTQHRENHYGVFLKNKGKAASEEPEAQSGDGDDALKVHEFVLSILSSGLPFTPFTEAGLPIYRFLQSEGARVCSRKTFVKYAKQAVECALEKMFEMTRRQFVFITLDSTPGMNAQNYITARLVFIDKSGVFRDLHFGVVLADGVLSGEDYTRHIQSRASAMELKIFDWTFALSASPRGAWNDYCFPNPSGRDAVLLGGSSDMGPGALQALQQMFGKEAVSCDAAHGQNNITKAAVEASTALTTASRDMNALCKKIRKSGEARAQIRALGKTEASKSVVLVPPKSKKIRWGSFSSVGKYTVKYFDQLSKLDAVKDTSEMEDVRHSLKKLQSSRELFDVLDQSQSYLQAQGPCDAIVIPYALLNTIALLQATVPKASWMRKVHTFIVTRFHRRFFHGSLLLPTGIDQDKTRKYSFFDNMFVKAAFALSPVYDFSVFVTNGLMNAEDAAILSRDCDEALLRVHRAVDPGFFDSASQSSSSGAAGKGLRPSFVKTNESRFESHMRDVDAFRKCEEVQSAFLAMFEPEDFYSNPGSRRKTFLTRLLACADDQKKDWLRIVIRVVMAFPVSTVECERDFSWFQDILKEKRLNTSSHLIAAYLLAKRSPFLMRATAEDLSGYKVKAGEKLTKPVGNTHPGVTRMTQFFEKDVKRQVKATSTTLEASSAEDEVSGSETSSSSDSDEEESAGAAAAAGASVVPGKSADQPSGPRRSRRNRQVPARLAGFFHTLRGRAASRDELDALSDGNTVEGNAGRGYSSESEEEEEVDQSAPPVSDDLDLPPSWKDSSRSTQGVGGSPDGCE